MKADVVVVALLTLRNFFPGDFELATSIELSNIQKLIVREFVSECRDVGLSV